MAIRKIKPNTPGQRFMTVSTYEEITCTTPERSLMESLKSNAGRNNKGRITVRHRGGGAKRQYRIIDFKRNKDNIPAKVATVDKNGKVTATKRGSGSATIICTVTDSNGNVVKDTCKVSVKLSFGQILIVYVLFGWIWY